MSYGFRTLRFVLASACVLAPAVAVVGQASSAYADNESDATAANEAGKQMMIDSNFAGASKQFSIAISKSGLAKYSLNLCNSLLYEGRYDESLQACNEANTKNPDAKTAEKISKMIDKVRTEAHNANVKLFDEQPTGPGPNPDPNNPNPNPNPDPNNPNPNPDPNNPNAIPVGPAVGRPPAVGKPPTLQKIESPKHVYTWTLGGSLATGSGSTATTDTAITVAGLRLQGDYLFAPQIGVGAHLRIDLFNISGDYAGSESANLANVGLGIYKHVPLNRIAVTPYAGIAGYTLSDSMDTSARIQGTSLYLGASVGYAMGARGEHFLSASLDYNRALSGQLENSTVDFEGFGYATFGVGYTYRFNTPFGSSRSGGSFFLE